MALYDKDLPSTSYIDDYDDFWDVSKLVPKKKPSAFTFSTSEKTADVIIDASDAKKYDNEDKKINFDLYKTSEKASDNLIRTYTPEYAKLIKSVTIRPSVDRFDFHDTFRKAALIYFDYKCPKCDFVSFYSYMPQYAQMTTEQKKYYFYWRDELRHGRYLKIDYSYIYLYAYEILNLPDKIGREEGLKLLCDVWCAYRKALPRLDSNFSAWIQDYCLVYEMKCPYDIIGDFLFDIINVSSFKEFYLSDISQGGNAASAMIAYLSDYDWRRGKYASGDRADAYRRHMESAMKYVFEKAISDENLFESDLSKISRTAFPGSLCTHNVKCILDIEYYSISHSPKLREEVTAALKYTENKLRACLGVKSRLAVKELPDSLKAVIDRYFESEFKRLERERARANLPEYEHLYDAPSEKLSFENAIEIEKASWRMTARLTEGVENEDSYASEKYDNESAFDENIEFSVLDATENEKNSQNGEDSKVHYGLDKYELDFIKAALCGDLEEERKISLENKVPIATLAETVNEAFSDNFGDIILEENDDGVFVVMDDYYEEISEWVK